MNITERLDRSFRQRVLGRLRAQRCGRGVMGLGWFMLITGVIILGMEHQRAVSLGLDESNGALLLEHYGGPSGSGHYSPWASWVPHLCPSFLRRTSTLTGLNLTWEHPTERTIFFTQTSCSSALTPREVYKHFSIIL